MSYDLEELRRLRDDFSRASRPPGLFHVTRILFGLEGDPHEGLDQGWEEFLGDTPPFELSVDEVCGPFFQQSGYFGAIEKLNDYTGLAAVTLGPLPSGTSPIVYHHREARTDRNQWTLGLYRISKRLEWQIAVDFKGAGIYSKLDFDNDALNLLGCFVHDPDSLRRYHESWKAAIEQRDVRPPRYAYAAIVTDLFKASALAIDLHIKDIAEGRHDPQPWALLPERMALPHDNEALTKDSPAAHEGQQKAAGEKIDEKTDPWPPDDGWHFRPGEFAFGGMKGELTGKLWMLLKAFAEARRSLTSSDLLDDVWGHNETCTEQNLRNHLSRLRTALRNVYDLAENVDPIPAVDKGNLAAWRLEEKRLIRVVSAD